MTRITTFPSDSFGYLLGLFILEEEPVVVVLGRQTPEVHYPFPRTETNQFTEAIRNAETEITVFTDGEYTWCDEVKEVPNVELNILQEIPATLLITDSIIAEAEGENASTSSTVDAKVTVKRNPSDRESFLNRKCGI